jgi:hypothetical protein
VLERLLERAISGLVRPLFRACPSLCRQASGNYSAAGCVVTLTTPAGRLPVSGSGRYPPLAVDRIEAKLIRHQLAPRRNSRSDMGLRRVASRVRTPRALAQSGARLETGWSGRGA